jgi:subtilase family serine protease
MRSVRWWSTVGAAALVVSGIGAAGGIPAATAAPSGRAQLQGSAAPAAARSRPQGQVAASSSVNFDLVLTLKDAQGAQAMANAVSTPGSALFHHYLSVAQWEAAYAPSQKEVSAAKSWLRQQGFTVGAVPADRLFISAQGSAAQVERAFATTLGNFQVNGKTVRLATTPLSVPTSLAGTVSAVVGVNQYVAVPALAAVPASTSAATPQDPEPLPPAGFANPQPCSAFWAQKHDIADKASLYTPFTPPLPYDICGYKPAQLRSAYNILSATNGTGVSVGIVDAYDSPTIQNDAKKYFVTNDSTHPLAAGQLVDQQLGTPANEDLCGGSGWFAEQALDVEAVHAMAPGASIQYWGAQDCLDNNLFAAENDAITNGAKIVSNSWGDTLGDIFADHSAFDPLFQLAIANGVSVLFSSGDSGDNFAISGFAVPDYPATSPFVTTVGGTALQVSSTGARAAEFGWSTAKRVLCASKTTNCGLATKPAGALLWNAGGGGGTSFNYTQAGDAPYQAGVVPNALALRNEALVGPVKMRVEPDISMDADAQTGMLIGLTQTFPGPSVHYAQFKEGGTSLASPLMAGVVADADQAAKAAGHTQLGFLNFTLYGSTFRTAAGALRDIVPPALPLSAATNRVDFANGVNSALGFVVSQRVLDYQGPETFCDGTGNCATRPVILTTAKGFDSMTGLGSPGPNFIFNLAKF